MQGSGANPNHQGVGDGVAVMISSVGVDVKVGVAVAAVGVNVGVGVGVSEISSCVGVADCTGVQVGGGVVFDGVSVGRVGVGGIGVAGSGVGGTEVGVEVGVGPIIIADAMVAITIMVAITKNNLNLLCMFMSFHTSVLSAVI